MVLETALPPFDAWIGPAFLFFVQAAALLGFLALLIGYLVAAFRYGPLGGGDAVYRTLRTALLDLVSLSPRRILALAWLAVQESLRRRVLVGFGIFVLILLFAGWFLDTQSTDPATLYVSFVLTATTYLVLLMALFLSAFSLPADIKNHTIYTVVTKPVRPGEIVLGRILGFSAIGTLLLAVMGVLSYVFVLRVLHHTHEVEIASLEPAPADSSGALVGRTSSAANHRHQVTIDTDGKGSTDIVQGHWHEVDKVVEGDATRYVVGPPRDLFTARVPAYATSLRFKDRTGAGSDRGINVGNEWKYRSFIEGGTLAAAVWTFDGITPENFPKGLPIEMTVRVFRSHKGDIEKGILGSLVLKNPRTGRASSLTTFRARDYYIDQRFIPRKLTDPAGNSIDLFDHLVDGGQLEIQLQCLDDSQYFGVAKPDIYLRARDASFALNVAKSYVGIWLQMLLVTSFGVMFSTFLSGAVAMMATLAALVLGFFTQFVYGVAVGTVEGGGPVESFVRLITQRNVTSELEPGLTKDIVQAMDNVFMFFMEAVTRLLPDFRRFSDVDYVAHGFDIPGNVLAIQLVQALGYVLAVSVIGYFFLRTREVAR
jgi:ABC-type transport system involved in multi-copper enzyme maturation permease subunit